VLLSLPERCAFFSGSMIWEMLDGTPSTGDATAFADVDDDGAVEATGKRLRKAESRRCDGASVFSDLVASIVLDVFRVR